MRAGPRRRPLRERTCQLARTGLANTILARVAHEEGAAQAAARQRAARRARNREERYTGVSDTEGISREAEPEPDPFADLPELDSGSSSSGGEGEGEPIWVREPAGVPRRLWPRLRADRPASTGGRPVLTEAEFAECVPGLSGVPAPAPLPVGHAFGFVDTSLDVAGAFLRLEPRAPRRLANSRPALLRPGLLAQREFASTSERWLAERAVPDVAAAAERAAQLGVHLSASELEAEAAAVLRERVVALSEYGPSYGTARPTRTAECPGPQGPPPQPYAAELSARLRACELATGAAADAAHSRGARARGARPTRTAECPGPSGPPAPYLPIVYAELAPGGFVGTSGSPIPPPLSEEEYRAGLHLPFGSHRASVRAAGPVFRARPAAEAARPGLEDPGVQHYCDFATAEVLRLRSAAVLAELGAPSVRAGLRRLELLEAISLLCEDRSLDALSAIHDVLVTMQDYGQRG